MTKEELGRLYWLKKELKAAKDRYRELREAIDGLKATEITGMPGAHNPDSDAIASRIARMEELSRKIDEKKTEAWEERERIENFIFSIDDPLMRMILTYRFVDNLPWYRVAMSIGGTTEDAVRMAFERFMEKQKENEDDCRDERT